MMKSVFLLNLVLKINALFRLYNTDVLYRNDLKDCLYSNEINNNINEWILIRYCIGENDFDSKFKCYGNIQLTFEELKLRNILSENLFQWNAPIDTMNNYEKYLVTNNISMKTDLYCNCSKIFFGKDCSYKFDEEYTQMTFTQIVFHEFNRKESLEDMFEIINDEDLLTCYEGLKCNSTICLDWRQICDGFMDCENGEDEFVECFLIELNQCQENEYRCLNGMCIPKTFLIDLSYDCGDITDEEYSIDEFINVVSDCYKTSMILCDFSQSRWGLFSCGDGEYESIEDADVTVCSNGRHLFYHRNLFLLSNNENFDCWFLLYCVSSDIYLDLIGYDESECLCTIDDREDKYCWRYFQKYCPDLFSFQTDHNFMYPFIQMIFNKTQTNRWEEWWEPTHLCYQNKSCSNFLNDYSILINGLICIEREMIPDFFSFDYYSLKNLLSYCHISIEDNQNLFYCNQSKQWISKYHIGDSIQDCFYEEDENMHLTSLFHFPDRFKCRENNISMIRSLILTYDNDDDDFYANGLCPDEPYKLYVGKCIRPSDLACQFIRGTYLPLAYNIFRENCNGKLHLPIPIDNETDENHCEEWSTNKCDNYWDFPNGIDELDCSSTITSYLTQNVFHCHSNERYCPNENGTMNCLAKEYLGNGIIDCLGAIDERQIFQQDICTDVSYSGFLCRSKECISPYLLCDKQNDCKQNDDEIICPWLLNSTCNQKEFPCKNGTCIPRVKNQCNQIIHCQPDGEDEWFCDFIYLKSKQFLLDNLKEYSFINYSVKSAIIHPTNRTLPMEEIVFEHQYNWYCNRGIEISKRKCLCPPSYYGSRWQYQSERILITIRIDIPISLIKDQTNENNHFLLIIARLILDEKVFDYEQILHQALMKQIFYLNYPKFPPKQKGNWSVRFDVYLINQYQVDSQSAWLFNVPFSFLPVNRLVLHLMMRDSQQCQRLNCIRGICRRYLNDPYEEYCQCEENWSGKFCNETVHCSCTQGGKCLDGICICRLGRIGKECRVLFNPCLHIQCQNGGKCLPLHEYQLQKFICSCSNDYYGIYCERINSQIQIEFASVLSRLGFVSLFVHFLRLEKDSPGILFIDNRIFYKQIQLNKILNVYNHNHDYLSTFILIEIYSQNHVSNLYIGAILKQNLTNIKIKIDQTNRCPYVDELIHNETIRKFHLRRKLKYYHSICEMNHNLRCFQDESSLCFCDKYDQPDCLIYQRQAIECRKNYCQNNGQCIEHSFNGFWDFSCVCQGCSYGSLCQLITSEYILSFDVILGQDIRANRSFKEQNFLIKFVFGFIILMILIGTLSNVLSMITFRQGKIPEYGCGIYLFCLTIIGQIGLGALASRYFYLLITQLYHLKNYWSTYWSCIILEYILTICPMLFDWLILCIAIERCINVVQGTSFKKNESTWWAQRLIPLLIFIIICCSLHELFIHELISDPRSTSEHTWCVIKFRWNWIKYYRLIIYLFNLIIPGLLNLIATIFLLHKTTQRKQLLEKRKNEKKYWKVLRKQIPMYGSPFGLVIFSIIRVIFSFTLVCITKQWHKYLYLIAYFISFAPFMATFPIFVLPAEVYKTEFKNFLARFLRKLRRWI